MVFWCFLVTPGVILWEYGIRGTFWERIYLKHCSLSVTSLPDSGRSQRIVSNISCTLFSVPALCHFGCKSPNFGYKENLNTFTLYGKQSRKALLLFTKQKLLRCTNKGWLKCAELKLNHTLKSSLGWQNESDTWSHLGQGILKSFHRPLWEA